MAKHRFDQLRVVASPEGMFVRDANGKNIQVFAVNIALRAGKPPIMQMNLLSQFFDVAGAATFMVQDPATGQPKAAKRIEWHDGTVMDFPEVVLPADAPPMNPQPPANPQTPGVATDGGPASEVIKVPSAHAGEGGNA